MTEWHGGHEQHMSLPSACLGSQPSSMQLMQGGRLAVAARHVAAHLTLVCRVQTRQGLSKPVGVRQEVDEWARPHRCAEPISRLTHDDVPE